MVQDTRRHYRPLIGSVTRAYRIAPTLHWLEKKLSYTLTANALWLWFHVEKPQANFIHSFIFFRLRRPGFPTTVVNQSAIADWLTTVVGTVTWTDVAKR